MSLGALARSTRVISSRHLSRFSHRRFRDLHTSVPRLESADPRVNQLRYPPGVFMGDNIVNFYAGQPPLNRLSFQRQSTEKLNQHLNSPDARFIVFKNAAPLVHKGTPGRTLHLGRDSLAKYLQDGFAGPSPELEGSRKAKALEAYREVGAAAVVFLGIDDRPNASTTSKPASYDPQNPEGVPYFAVNVPDDYEVPAEGEFYEARLSGGEMDAWEAGIFSGARSLIDWNVRYKFCAGCGKRNYSLWGGWKLNCSSALEESSDCPSTKGLHNYAYPRTDPVTIMGILNPAGDKILLGRQKSWPEGMYSCLAGFVEPGESFEDAVRREVLEEAGIEVGPVRYSSSQPWPFPSTLMVGCYGRAKDGQTIRLDLDNELQDAQWFDRSYVLDLIASETSGLSRDDIKQLARRTEQHREGMQALAPTDSKTAGTGEKGAMTMTKMPPATAIAGQLVRLWARGELELVGKL